MVVLIIWICIIYSILFCIGAAWGNWKEGVLLCLGATFQVAVFVGFAALLWCTLKEIAKLVA